MVGLDDASSAIRVKLLAGRVLSTCMADAARSHPCCFCVIFASCVALAVWRRVRRRRMVRRLNGCHDRAACDARRDRATRPATPRQRNFSTRSRVACIDAGATSSESVVHWRGSGSLAQVEAAADSLAQQGIWQGPRHTRANLCRRRFRERNTSVVPSPSSSRRFYPCACNAVRGIETGP